MGPTDVALSLNLRYTDPANASEGGTWALVARTGSTDGLAGVSAYIQNINETGIVTGNGGVAKPGYPGVINAATIGTIEQSAGSPFKGTFNDVRERCLRSESCRRPKTARLCST